MARPSRKSDQRARIHQAMIEVLARKGYAQANIAQAISLAHVSRSTFYQHFDDKLDCFLSIQSELNDRVMANIERIVDDRGHEDCTCTAIQGLVELVEHDPAGARVVLSESLAAGPRAMDARDALMERIGHLIEESWASLPPGARQIDVPACVLVGGACRLLSIRLLRGAGGTPDVLSDLLSWVESYGRSDGQTKWRTLGRKDLTALVPSPHAEIPPTTVPARLPSGRHNLPASYIAANQRERILRATVAVILKKGYTATTVGDIVAEAQLTRAAFYQHFRDKAELLSAINQVNFEQMMAVTARAFFSEEVWPERVWAAIHAAGEMNASHPAGAHIGFIDTNLVGPELTRRVNDIIMAFAVFIEEGYSYRPDAEALPRLCSEAIASALCELMYGELRQERAARFRDLIPYVAYVALAPFMGPETASEFVEGKLRKE